MISFEEAIIQMKEYDCPAMLYEEGGIRFSELNTQEKKSFALFVGSEGGFDEAKRKPPEKPVLRQYGLEKESWDAKLLPWLPFRFWCLSQKFINLMLKFI